MYIHNYEYKNGDDSFRKSPLRRTHIQIHAIKTMASAISDPAHQWYFLLAAEPPRHWDDSQWQPYKPTKLHDNVQVVFKGGHLN
jgi:hypothetical protein